MRLGIDASNLRIGGGITHLVELLRAARPLEHGIDRVVLWTYGQLASQLPVRPWLTVVPEPELDRPLPLRLLWQTVRLTRLAAKACDILFAPGGIYAGSFRPFVAMSRNMLPFERRERQRYGLSWMGLRLALLRVAQSRGFRQASGVIFLSRYACSTVMKQVPGIKGEIAIIPHGVVPQFLAPPRPQRPLTDYSFAAPFRLLYVSILDVYKHQEQVVQAVALLRQEGLPVKLDLVGPAYPPVLSRLTAMLRQLDPQGNFINYAGPLPYAEMPGVNRNADGFVFASSCENMPNILLEAMASGLPIACSGRGPMPEVLGEAGVYFDPEDPTSIAAALRELLSSPEMRARWAQAAYQRARGFSWEQCAQQTFEFLAQVASGSGR